LSLTLHTRIASQRVAIVQAKGEASPCIATNTRYKAARIVLHGGRRHGTLQTTAETWWII